MRFHSLRPLPSIGIDASKVQRAAPTCTVSLTSVSVTASMSGTSTSDASSSSSTCTVTSMDIDPATQSVSESSPSAFLAKAKHLIQFPTSSSTTKTKRTHSLLRPSTLADTSFGSTVHEAEETGESGASMAEEKEEEAERERELPARKRTRTCAMVTPATPPSRGRNFRRHSISTSSRSSSAPAYQEKHEIFDDLLGDKASTAPEVAPQPTPSPPPPILETVTLVLSPQEHLTKLQTQPNNLIYLVSLPPSALYRKRRLNQLDSRILLYLYRSLVYGTQVRFNEWVQDTTSLDAQDAILALRLRTFLLSIGTPAPHLIVDLESIAGEGAPSNTPVEEREGCSQWMRMVIASNAAKDFRHRYHLEPSTMHSVLSYQQLIATIFLRHFTEGSMSRYSWKRKRLTKCELFRGRQRLPSKLRESFTRHDFEVVE